MDFSNLFHKRIYENLELFKFQIFIYSLIFLFSIFSSLSANETETIQDFLEKRFSLQPPTEQEELAVVNTVQKFLDRIHERNVTDAYFSSTSPEFRNVVSFDRFKQLVQKLSGYDFKQNVKKNNVSFSNNEKTKANFNVLLTNPNDNIKYYIEFSLDNQEGDWKIMNIKIYEIYHTEF